MTDKKTKFRPLAFRITIIVALLLGISFVSFVLINNSIQKTKNSLFDKSICRTYEDLLSDQINRQLDIVEKALVPLINQYELLHQTASGTDGGMGQMLIDGLFLSFEKTGNLERFAIISNSGELRINQKSDSLPEVSAEYFKIPEIDNAKERSVESWKYEYTLIKSDEHFSLATVMAIRDNDDKVVGSIVAMLPLSFVLEELSEKMNVNIALQALKGGDIVYCSNPELKKGIKKGFGKNVKEYNSSIIKQKGITCLAHLLPLKVYSQEGENNAYLWMGTDYSKMYKTLVRMNILLWIVSIVILAVTIFVVWILLKRQIQPLKKVLTVLKGIAQGGGDLTTRIDVSTNDEIGEVARWFNTFEESLQKIIGQVFSNAEILLTSSQELNEASLSVTEKTDNSSKRSDDAFLSAENATGNITSISNSANVMSESVSVIAESINQMNISLNDVASNVEKESEIASFANEKAKEASGKINDMESAAKEVSKIVEVISDIADKTNLLALNATIEAASAGEAGRGFAVVANEVKELAKQTATATENIKNQVMVMLSITDKSISSVKDIGTVIGEVDSISQTIVSAIEEQSATLNEIAGNMSNASGSAESIASSVQSAAEELSKVSSELEMVKKDTAESAKDAGFIKGSSEKLKELAEDLSTIVGQFKI